jgi:hypothetical protein
MKKIPLKVALIIVMIAQSVTTNSVFAQAKKAKSTTTIAKAKTPTAKVEENLPTKEETIAWLKEKLSLYTDFRNLKKNGEAGSIELNECELVIFEYNINLTGQTITDYLPIVGLNFGAGGGDLYSYKYDAIKTVYSSDGKWKHSGKDGSLYDEEPNLRERMQKAFAHLATFCQEKKEKF